LDNLPINLEILECFGCKIKKLNNLPESIKELSYNNDIKNINKIKKQRPNINFYENSKNYEKLKINK